MTSQKFRLFRNNRQKNCKYHTRVNCSPLRWRDCKAAATLTCIQNDRARGIRCTSEPLFQTSPCQSSEVQLISKITIINIVICTVTGFRMVGNSRVLLSSSSESCAVSYRSSNRKFPICLHNALYYAIHHPLAPSNIYSVLFSRRPLTWQEVAVRWICSNTSLMIEMCALSEWFRGQRLNLQSAVET